MSGVEDDPCPKRGETRVINGSLCRFIEREIEGDKWVVLGPAPTEQADGDAVAWRLRRVGAELWNLWDADPREDTPAYADTSAWEVQPLYATPPATPIAGGEEPDRCPICAEPFKADDQCAIDITEGTCHAACLEGSPVVDLDTEEPSDGPIWTFRYDSLPQPKENPCGGCGESDPARRCIGCLHDFAAARREEGAGQ